MSNRYAIDTDATERLNLHLLGEWASTVYPRSPSPTLLAIGKACLMRFGIAEKPTGPAYNNARIETPTK